MGEQTAQKLTQKILEKSPSSINLKQVVDIASHLKEEELWRFQILE